MIIPCAGEGSRMYEISKGLPKQMLIIKDKPVISWILDILIKKKFEYFIIIINDNDKYIKNFIKSNYKNININFIYQKELNGLLGAIKLAQPFIKSSDQLIFLSDTITFDFFDFDEDFVAYKQVQDFQRWCLIETKDGYVKQFIDKPKSKVSTNKALIGVYYIKNSQLWDKCIQYIINQNIKVNKEFQISSALEIYIKTIKVHAKEVKTWLDIGSPDNYFKAIQYFQDIYREED